MADLKTFWDNPGAPTSTDLSSDLATSSGSDPLVSTDGESGLSQLMWKEPPVPSLTSGAETANSVSGLPAEPNRYQPSDTPPPPPTLQDRRPGNIDES